MESVYIHIPFCRSICSYCDFSRFIYNEKEADKYLNALEEEVKEYYLNEEIKTIYIGGGTPSVLSETLLNKLFKIINLFNKSKNLEFTIECNPEDINESFLDLIIKHGVNRISIGVQSFNKTKLEFMKRNSDFLDLKTKINLIRQKGINNISLDLMYALPKEELNVFKKDVKMFLKLNPDHISTYSLIIKEGTEIFNKFDNTEEEIEIEMYNYLVKKLKKKKYNHYEVSNFSKEGYESKHNLTYWNNKEYYGFGLSSSGYINGFRYENTKNMKKYLEGNYRDNEKLLSKQEIMEDEVMLGLRKIEGINVEEFYEKYNVNIQDVFPVKPLLKNKELVYKNGYLFINKDKIYVMNEILLKLI